MVFLLNEKYPHLYPLLLSASSSNSSSLSQAQRHSTFQHEIFHFSLPCCFGQLCFGTIRQSKSQYFRTILYSKSQCTSTILCSRCQCSRRNTIWPARRLPIGFSIRQRGIRERFSNSNGSITLCSLRQWQSFPIWCCPPIWKRLYLMLRNSVFPFGCPPFRLPNQLPSSQTGRSSIQVWHRQA